MLDFLIRLFEISLGCGVVAALLLLLIPRLSIRFSPRWRYWAWLLLSLRLAVLVDISLPRTPLEVEVPSVLTANPHDYAADYARAMEQSSQGVGSSTSTIGGLSRQYNTRYAIDYTDQSGEEVLIRSNFFFRQVIRGSESTLTLHWDNLLFVLWMAGAVGCACWTLFSHLQFRRRVLRWSRPAGLRAEGVEVRWCGLVPSPLLMGLVHPVILLPGELPGSAVPTTLAHELTHKKRRDLWYMLLLVFARSIHWFNPLVWLMVRQARRDMELCCDYDLLKGQGEEARRAYGQAILDQMTAGQGVSPLTTGFSGDKKSVFLRFRAIMDTRAKRSGAILLALALLATALSQGLVSITRAQESPAQGGGAVTAFLQSQPEQSLTASYYEDGFDWNYGALPSLTMSQAADTLTIRLPGEAASSQIRISEDRYLTRDQETSVERRSWAQQCDENSSFTLSLEGTGGCDMEKAVYFLAWGEDSSFRYVFQVTLSLPKTFRGTLGPDGAMLVHGSVSPDLSGVNYERVDWFGREDAQSEADWWEAHWTYGWLEERSAPLAEGAQLFYYHGDQILPLPTQAIEPSMAQAQDGVLLELTFDSQGQVTKVVMRREAVPDPSAPTP